MQTKFTTGLNYRNDLGKPQPKQVAMVDNNFVLLSVSEWKYTVYMCVCVTVDLFPKS